ncbi:TetR/AcrR family transcriptional regulator [Nocardia sp. CA-084685]|uniref:TetR/AcrR family transcriptional regulator n=1 Tax=Nocardia sp. CA-084685 TaxID=3239970 RepID=UPI003D99E8A7
MSEPTADGPTDQGGATTRRADGEGPRTRGGWTPSGTAAKRRATSDEHRRQRSQRTREEIIVAARRVFERGGYLDVGVDDIVAEAGVARGSFYTYFPTKLEVFKVLAARVGQQIRDAVGFQPEDAGLDSIAALNQSQRRYIDVYRDNAGIYGLIEQLSTIDEHLHEIRLTSRRNHVERVAERIRRWQHQGLADPTVDAETTAAALVSMTSNFCYWWFVGQDRYDEDQAVATINMLWVRAVDLRRRPRPSWVTHVRKEAPTS